MATTDALDPFTEPPPAIVAFFAAVTEATPSASTVPETCTSLPASIVASVLAVTVPLTTTSLSAVTLTPPSVAWVSASSMSFLSLSVTDEPEADTSPVKSLFALAAETAFFAVKSAVVPSTTPVSSTAPSVAPTLRAEPAFPTAPETATPVLPSSVVLTSPATEPVEATSTAPSEAFTLAPVFAETAPLTVTLPETTSMSAAPSVAVTSPNTRTSLSFSVTPFAVAVMDPKSFWTFSAEIEPFSATSVVVLPDSSATRTPSALIPVAPEAVIDKLPDVPTRDPASSVKSPAAVIVKSPVDSTMDGSIEMSFAAVMPSVPCVPT